MTIEPLLLTSTRITTMQGGQVRTQASGFFFARGERLFLVTSRHVVHDPDTRHHPDHLEIELHSDGERLQSSVGFSIPLYRQGQGLWRQGRDGGGEIDVAVIELQRDALPAGSLLRAFTPEHLQSDLEAVEVGSAVLIVGFPLGFHDTLHHLPVVRQALIASSFGIRFQGQGFFLTDARTHRGTSGAPVVMRRASAGRGDAGLRWTLLGVHSARFDVGHRDRVEDESLGLNSAWYADILLTLTAPAGGTMPEVRDPGSPLAAVVGGP